MEKMPEPSNSLPTEEPIVNHHVLINLWQTAEERQGKYWLAISFGATPNNARRMRDWRLVKIERLFNLAPSKYHSRRQHDKQLKKLGFLPPRLDREPGMEPALS